MNSSRDYSFLINSVQENILKGPDSSVNKRKRPLSVDLDESIGDHPPASGSSLSLNTRSSANIKLAAEIEELKLLNSQLTDQVQSYKKEHVILKDQAVRQLQFLEEQNKRLRSERDEKSQRYHDEKKKWQEKNRELESQVKLLEMKVANSGSNGSTRSSENILLNQANEQLRLFETKIRDQSAMIKRLQEEKITLEAENARIVNELRTVKASTSAVEDERAEVYSMKKKIQELESNLKKKTRENERMEQRLANQILLEEEIKSLKSELELLRASNHTIQKRESEMISIMDERKHWQEMFRSVLNTDENVNANDDFESITPKRVITTIKDLQQKCLTLQRSQGDLMASISELRRELLSSETIKKYHEEAILKLTEDKHELEKKLQLNERQRKVYEGEVTSLRSLLKTFDLEFQLQNTTKNNTPATINNNNGSNNTNSSSDENRFLKLKDEMIDGLRRELDEARAQLNALSTNNQSNVNDGQQATMNTNTNTNSAVSVDELQQELMTKKDELAEIQEITSIDYIPSKTKVTSLLDS